MLRKSLIFLLFFAAGCEHTYKEIRSTTAAPRPEIRSDSRIFVTLPDPYKTKKDEVTEAAPKTAKALRDAFHVYSKNVFGATKPAELGVNLDLARKDRCEYLVIPTILKWEDHDTEWSGRRDRISIKVQLIEVTSGQTIDEVTLEGTSRWLTDGGDKPQDLLEDPVGKYVASLFHLKYVPSGLKSERY